MSIEIQQQIRQNAQELQDFINDIEKWEADIKKKDMELSNKEYAPNEQIPPIRPKRKKNAVAAAKPANGKSLVTDYQQWEKFDVDKALVEADKSESESEEDESEEEEDSDEENQEEKLKLKEKGNNLFKAGEYTQAVEMYSRAILKFPDDATLHANRAMALIKLDSVAAATEDLDKALTLDPSYVKAHYRRAGLHLQRGDLCPAYRDIERALQLEPSNQASVTLQHQILAAFKKDTTPIKVPIEESDHYTEDISEWKELRQT